MADPFQIAKLEEEIHSLESSSINGSDWDWVRSIIVEKKETVLWSFLRAEQRSWLQKSRIKRLNEGDRNTKFFQIVASSRRRVNAIEQIMVNDTMCWSLSMIKESIAAYFENHFNKETTIPLKAFNCDFLKLKEGSVMELEKQFMEAEIWDAVKSCDGVPDGFSIEFIKNHWSMLKEDVLGIVDLRLKNRALLNKWLWRYAKENNALWRRVIDGVTVTSYLKSTILEDFLHCGGIFQAL
ncbi:hypothetical protein DITRI_Ditri10aG0038600 [Diplodiscus trichospermus]